MLDKNCFLLDPCALDKVGQIRWSTNTCRVQEDLLGIWPDDSEGADVNCVAVDEKNGLVFTGDDYAIVKVFRYPCNTDNAPHLSYLNHSD